MSRESGGGAAPRPVTMYVPAGENLNTDADVGRLGRSTAFRAPSTLHCFVSFSEAVIRSLPSKAAALTPGCSTRAVSRMRVTSKIRTYRSGVRNAADKPSGLNIACELPLTPGNGTGAGFGPVRL